MIQITCPNNNIPERTYAIEVLFVDILGCKHEDFVIQFSDLAENYELITENSKVIIEDHFFNQYLEPLSYMKRENIPTELRCFHGLGLEVPIIYGEDKFVKEEKMTIIGLDIFASTFFMLTRWEESLLGREEKGDCDETQLFCVKHGIHQRPIVNEYAVFLRKMLPVDISLPKRQFEVVLSHDVDGFHTPTWTQIAKDLLRQTIHGAPKNKVFNLTWKEKVKYKQAFPTAYSQFKLYTDLAEKYKIPEWFYFKVCGKGETEATYLFDDKRTIDVVEKLKRKNNPNFVLGFHPSQNMFQNEQQWNKEVSRITELLHENPIIGRNHHLLYNFMTLRLWEKIADNPLNISNCVFHRRQGFRSGVCVPYHLFDLYERRVMNLMEHPCQIMDMGIRYDSKDHTDEQLWNELKMIIDKTKSFSGELVLTWHIYVRMKKVILNCFKWCEKTVQYAVSLR